MSVDFKSSETKLNLMRAFAGESQARNRYDFAAEKAKNQNLYVIESIFKFTANQEQAHAKVYYDHLKEVAGQTINVDGGYPIDISDSISELLKMAQHNEYQEYEDVYKAFGDKAEEEGFLKIASSFRQIAKIEKAHGDRFETFYNLLEQKKLFVSDVDTKWMCLNCGHIYEGKSAPLACPVCNHNQGYFVRIEFAPYTNITE